MKPNITVIVPIYNVEKYLRKCLLSLINQTYKNFEVLAVDDGSPDNSSKVVREYIKKDSRIRLVQKENGGYGSVLQYAIENIESKYFLVCDPDDWLEKNALEVLYNTAQRSNLDIVVADKFDVYVGENKKNYSKFKPNNFKIKPNQIYTSRNDIYKFSFGFVSPHAKLYKTDIVKNIKFPKKVSFTDFLLFMVALANAKSILYVDKPLANYLIDRPGNTTTEKSLKKIDDYCTVWDITYKEINKKNIDKAILFYRLYSQLKFILLESKYVKDLNKTKYCKYKILKRIDILHKHKDKIVKVIPTFEQKLLFIGFMCHPLRQCTAYIFCKLKQ